MEFLWDLTWTLISRLKSVQMDLRFSSLNSEENETQYMKIIGGSDNQKYNEKKGLGIIRELCKSKTFLSSYNMSKELCVHLFSLSL